MSYYDDVTVRCDVEGTAREHGEHLGDTWHWRFTWLKPGHRPLYARPKAEAVAKAQAERSRA